jgi:hypothetical protein
MHSIVGVFPQGVGDRTGLTAQLHQLRHGDSISWSILCATAWSTKYPPPPPVSPEPALRDVARTVGISY